MKLILYLLKVSLFTLLLNPSSPAKEDFYCEGKWGTQTIESKRFDYKIHASREKLDLSNISDSVSRFVTAACPVQVPVYTCYYHGNVTRAAELETREFFTDDGSCQRFDPLSFLHYMRGRKLVLYGDSLTGQFYQSLLCSIYPLLPAADFEMKVQFGKLPESHCNPIVCPFGNDNSRHAWFKEGWLRVKSYNFALIYIWEVVWNKDRFLSVYTDYNLGRYDILIANFGIWYNDMNLYHRDISDLKTQLLQYYRSKAKKSDAAQIIDDNELLFQTELPPTLWMQSSPQHFPGASGYFNKDAHYDSKQQCEPALNATEKYELDARNRIVDSIFNDLKSDQSRNSQKHGFPIRIIPHAKGVFSQYDAHIGEEPYEGERLDCTHWCFPSNIFKYLHRFVYNAIIRSSKHLTFPIDFNNTSNQVLLYPFGVMEGYLVKSSESRSVFLLQNGTRREFQSFKAFASRGFDLENVKTIDESVLISIPLGDGLF